MSWITAISILALCAGALLIGSGLSQHFRKGDDRIRRRLLEPETHGDEGGRPHLNEFWHANMTPPATGRDAGAKS